MTLQDELQKYKETMWEMMNYLNLYVVILDNKMNVVLANRYLIYGLGLESEKDILGRCWLDFIRVEHHKALRTIHAGVIKNDNQFTEVVTELISEKNEIVPVRWFNSPVNHKSQMTFSIGIPLRNNITAETSTQSIRAYFHNIIQRDRTFITAMRDVAQKEAENICAPTQIK